MSSKRDDGKGGIFGQSLPGTGGDTTPADDDVEGHSMKKGQPDSYGRNPRLPSADGGAEGYGRNPRLPSADGGEDTEGHLRRETEPEGYGRNPRLPSADGGAEGYGRNPRLPSADGGEDTEGHLYTGGPTTQGEFARRAPSENPHGER